MTERATRWPRGESQWSTDDVDRSAAVDYWRSIRRHVYVDVDTTPRHPEFVGEISSSRYGDYAVSTKRSNGETVTRSSRLIGQGSESDEYLFAVLPVSGSGAVVQAGNTAVFGPGEMVFYDSSIPFELDFDGAYEQVVIHVPAERAFATAGLRRGTDLLARAIPLDGALGSVSAFFLSLARAQVDDPAGASLLRPQVSGLASSLVAYSTAKMGSEDLPLLLRRERVVDFMRKNLADPDLDVDRIAAASHLSRRSLYRLFDGTGQTVVGQLRLLRIETAQKMLANRTDLAVGSIARDVGYASEAHFYRSFRSITGTTPGEYRNRESEAAPLLQS
ncbi:helix-turn-helix domain-containing protein [Tsukamurella sp. NPDC003166]|uniref:helix-turn-helix domain-containing protein n=1 Tax=Tsukamurella sp. NPDC003166 TaxID=3154444 RepID=UPI0033AA0AC5